MQECEGQNYPERLLRLENMQAAANINVLAIEEQVCYNRQDCTQRTIPAEAVLSCLTMGRDIVPKPERASPRISSRRQQNRQAVAKNLPPHRNTTHSY